MSFSGKHCDFLENWLCHFIFTLNYHLVNIQSQIIKVEISIMLQQYTNMGNTVDETDRNSNIPILLFTMTTAVAVASPKSERKYKASSAFKMS